MRQRALKKAARNQEPEIPNKPVMNKKSAQMIKDKIPSGIDYADYLL